MVFPGGWPGAKKFLFAGMRIVGRISLRHISGKYRVAEGAKASSFGRRELGKFRIRHPGHPPGKLCGRTRGIGIEMKHADEVRRLVFLITGTLFLPAPANSTSVVALMDKTNHRVVIAADCRVNRQLASVSECKIIAEPGCTVAMAGLYEEKATGFHLRQIANAACQYPGDLRAKAEAFLRFSKIPYERAVRHIRAADPDDFARTLHNKPTELIFAGLQDGQTALIVRGLVADSAGNISVERFESTAPSYTRTGFFLGLNGHIRAYVKAHADWGKEDYAKVASQFVEMEIEAHPDLASQPISEVEVDKEGSPHWLAKGVCVPRGSD
jgi:hypothetical protein